MGHASLTTATDGEVQDWLGERLRQLRREQRLSSSEAAKLSGLSRRTLYRAEHGQNPTLETLIRLLRLYGRLDSLAEALAEAEVSPMAVLERSRSGGRGGRG